MFPEAKKVSAEQTGPRMQRLLKTNKQNFLPHLRVHVGAGAPVHTCACGWDRFGNRRYLSRDRGRREEERETDNENQGEVMLAWGEEDRDQK